MYQHQRTPEQLYCARYKCNILFARILLHFVSLWEFAPRGVVVFMHGGLADVSFLSPFWGKLSLVCQHKRGKLIKASLSDHRRFLHLSLRSPFLPPVKAPAARGATCSGFRARANFCETWLRDLEIMQDSSVVSGTVLIRSDWFICSSLLFICQTTGLLAN